MKVNFHVKDNNTHLVFMFCWVITHRLLLQGAFPSTSQMPVWYDHQWEEWLDWMRGLSSWICVSRSNVSNQSEKIV